MIKDKNPGNITAADKRRAVNGILVSILILIIVAWVIFKSRSIPVNTNNQSKDITGVSRVRPDSLHPE